MQNVTVTRAENGFVIKAGDRQWIASKKTDYSGKLVELAEALGDAFEALSAIPKVSE